MRGSSRESPRGVHSSAILRRTMPTTKIEHARYIVTMDPARRIIRDGTLIFDGDRITAVGKAAALESVPADRVIDATGKVMTPGFVNGHIHISYAHAFRGAFPEDIEQKVYFPAIAYR